MDWRAWGPAEMAAEVRKHQGTKKTAKRQDIEGVLGGIENPRYLVALAAAMGTNVEMLATGKYQPPAEALSGAPAPSAVPQPPDQAAAEPDDLLTALSVLCDAIATTDELTRAQLAPLFAILTSEPSKMRAAAGRIHNLLAVVSEGNKLPAERRTLRWETDLDVSEWKSDDGQSAGVQKGRRAA